MPGPICVQCQVEMRCKLNEQFVNDVAGSGYWSGDLFECPCCAYEIVVGFGRELSDQAAELAQYGSGSITFARSVQQRSQYAHEFRNIEDTSKE